MTKKTIDFKDYIDKNLDCLHERVSIAQENILALCTKVHEMKVEEKVLGHKVNILKNQISEAEICLTTLRNSTFFQKIRFCFSPYSRY